ncbi:MAG TPA: hypothetical protein VG267_01630 [Terracidiphilus sp.]|nr:hypothetical protein [Terracidiphilus sp.]
MGQYRRDTVRGRLVPARGYAMVARALASTSHPVLVRIVPARFCIL